MYLIATEYDITDRTGATETLYGHGLLSYVDDDGRTTWYLLKQERRRTAVGALLLVRRHRKAGRWSEWGREPRNSSARPVSV